MHRWAYANATARLRPSARKKNPNVIDPKKSSKAGLAGNVHVWRTVIVVYRRNSLLGDNMLKLT
jgi:hypothetical protein